MILKKRNIFKLTIIAIICGILSVPTNSAPSKKKNTKKKKSTPSASCLACLAAFDDQKLEFTMDAAKCTKIVANCDKTNRTSQCENLILDCIDYNCTTDGSCADEMSNRSLFYGCLKATNQFLPYQCASYIAGFASSKASEVQSAQQAKRDAIEAQKAAAEKAQADADRAAANAETEKERIRQEAENKRKQLEQDNIIKLEQEKARLAEEAKVAELTRQAKLEEQKRNSQPNVKYNNLLSQVKKDISTAKTYSNKAYNLLGMKKTEDNQQDGTPLFFPPHIIEMDGISYSNDAKTRALVNGSKYKDSQKFVCTKDTKESFIKTELNNIYNTLKKTRDNLADGTSELEALNADEMSSNTISESKITTLYQTQNKLTEILQTVDSHRNELTTSCETRCAGFSSFNSNSTSSSGPLQFDENGNIIENKKETKSDEYSCKDFETSTSNQMDFSAMIMGQTMDMSDIVGGIGKKVSDLTQRVTRAVLEVDKLLDETEIAVQSGKFEGEGSDYPAIDTCIQYMVLDIASYTTCVQNVLGQQLLAFSKNKNSSAIADELEHSIQATLTNLKSANYYEEIKDECIQCGDSCNNGNIYEDGSNCKLGAINPTSVTVTTGSEGFEQTQICLLSITNALNNAVELKDKTGNSAFQVYTFSGNNVILIDGTSYDANTFANNKLKWKNATGCTLNKVENKVTSNTFGTQTTQSVLDEMASTITCTCNNKQTVANIRQLNYGTYPNCN